jgi:hypothetical protein
MTIVGAALREVEVCGWLALLRLTCLVISAGTKASTFDRVAAAEIKIAVRRTMLSYGLMM